MNEKKSHFRGEKLVISSDHVEAYGQNIALPKAVEVHYFEQTQHPHAPKTLPDGLTIEPFQVKSFAGRTKSEGAEIVGKLAEHVAPESVTKLSVNQFKTLYSAVGSNSGWWPLEDKQFDSKTLFGDTEMYMLRKNGKPIGFSCLERAYGGNAAKTGLVYIGVIPSEQGHGYGGQFFDHMVHKAWTPGTKSVALNTVPEFDLMQGTAHGANAAAARMYQKKGFDLVEKELKHPEPGKLNEFNIPDFYLRQAETESHKVADMKPTLTHCEKLLEKAFAEVRQHPDLLR